MLRDSARARGEKGHVRAGFLCVGGELRGGNTRGTIPRRAELVWLQQCCPGAAYGNSLSLSAAPSRGSHVWRLSMQSGKFLGRWIFIPSRYPGSTTPRLPREGAGSGRRSHRVQRLRELPPAAAQQDEEATPEELPSAAAQRPKSTTPQKIAPGIPHDTISRKYINIYTFFSPFAIEIYRRSVL